MSVTIETKYCRNDTLKWNIECAILIYPFNDVSFRLNLFALFHFNEYSNFCSISFNIFFVILPDCTPGTWHLYMKLTENGSNLPGNTEGKM